MNCWVMCTDALRQTESPSQFPALKQHIHGSYSDMPHGVPSASQPLLLRDLLS